MPLRYATAVLVAAIATEAAFINGGLAWWWGLVLLTVLAGAHWAPGSVQQVVAVGAGLLVYLGAVTAPWHPARLLVVASGLAFLFALDRGRRPFALPLAAFASSVAGIAFILGQTGWDDQTRILAAAGTALLIGCAMTWGTAVTCAAPGPKTVRPLPDSLRVAPETEDRLARAQGWALVLAAGTLPLGEGAAFCAAGILAVLMLLRWRLSVGPTPRRLFAGWVRAFWLLAAGWLAAGILATASSGEGLLHPRELGRIAPLALVPLVYLGARSLSVRWHRRAAFAFIVLLCLACGAALLQYLFNLGPDSPVMAPLAAFSAGAQNRVPGMPDHTVAGGFFFHRLKLAHVLVLGIALLTARQLYTTLPIRRRLLELAPLALFASTLLVTYTRAALLGVVAGAGLCALFATRRWRLTALAGIGLAAAVALTSPLVRDRILSMGSAAASAERALIWSQGVDIVNDYPFGVGLSNYPTLVKRYYGRVPPGRYMPPHHYAHHLVLSAWAETGPLGLVCFVLLFHLLGWAGLRQLRRAPPAPDLTRVAAGTILFAVTSFWVIGLTHDVLYHKPVALAFAAIIGLALVYLDEAEKPSRAQRNQLAGDAP